MSLTEQALPSSPDYGSAARLRVLSEVFGFHAFRPGQEAIIAALEAGRHVLAVMPTGSGKSLCYQIPALTLGSGSGALAVVVSPLVALMEDQVAALRLAGVAAATINSSRDRAANVATWREVAAGRIRLLYLSPERLMTAPMLAALGRRGVALIAVDEAHCISQWGASFRPEYEALAGLAAAFPGAAIGAFTATADEVTRADVAAKLFGGDCESFVHGFDRPNIFLAVAPKSDWKRQLLGFLDAHRGQAGIVYCLSRRKTGEVAALLQAEGHSALAYHAGMDPAGRAENQDRFMTEPGVVMVATIAFGMGIDKPDVRFVAHADLPGSPEAYYQEIGRAGRDGAPAEALLLYGLGDVRLRRRFIEEEGGGPDRQRREGQRLEALLAYCEAPECRRAVLLGYFGETIAPCGNCDVCRAPGAAVDGTGEALAILAAVGQTGQRFGAAHIADVLAGTRSEKVLAAGHHLRAAFAAGAARPKPQWRALIRQVVAAGLVEVDIAGFGGLAITDKGRALVRGEGAFRYRPDRLAGPARKARGASAPPAAAALGGAGGALLARLKTLRLALAQERGVPAYVVFPDRTLIDMAARPPADERQLADIHGVGAAKLREFGPAFLAEIAAFLNEAGG